MNQKLQKIKELRNKFHQFDNPSDIFVLAIKKECDNEGIDPYLVSCSDKDFETVLKKGNIKAF